MEPRRVLVVLGTRPEAIKLCPVVLALRQDPSWRAAVCATAQHRHLLDQVLAVFGVRPDYDLDAMQPGQTLADSTARILAGLAPVLRDERPDVVLVQGDTTTTLCGALAAFYARVPVGHVEAGLRTGDFAAPYPEEMNRSVTTRLAALHFAATIGAAANLRWEHVPDAAIHVTGNTGIDAVLHVRDRLASGELSAPAWPFLDTGRKLIVATAHRRESFGDGLDGICRALVRLADRGDVQVAYPVHPNPHVRRAVEAHLGAHPQISLLEPLDYVSFVDLMRRADLLLTDSGGIQEEAPSLGKPVLVLRSVTERPEAVAAGTAELVGTAEEHIVGRAARLLDDDELRRQMGRVHNPYGDGHASRRIADVLRSFC